MQGYFLPIMEIQMEDKIGPGVIQRLIQIMNSIFANRGVGPSQGYLTPQLSLSDGPNAKPKAACFEEELPGSGLKFQNSKSWVLFGGFSRLGGTVKGVFRGLHRGYIGCMV